MAETALTIAANLPPTAEDITRNYITTGGATLRVYQTFEVSGDAEIFRLADQDRSQQKQSFLQGLSRHPVLNNCPNFTLEAPQRYEQHGRLREALFMHQLRLAESPEPTLEDKLTGEMIGQRLDELSFIDAAAMLAADRLEADDRTQVAAILRTVGRELYGMPDKSQALSDIKRLLVKSADYADLSNHPLATVAQELNELVTVDAAVSTSKPETLSEADIDYYYELLEAECRPALDYAFEGYDNQDDFTVEEMQAVFSRYSESKGYDTAGLEIIIVPNRTMCATKHDPFVVEIGSKRSAGQRTRKRVTQSLIHEVEVHAGRIVRGVQLGSGLAGFGLRKFEIFEEALAGTIEGIVYKTAAPKGEMPVMTIALSAGYDSGHDRDFRDSFEALWRLQAVKAYKPSEDIDKQLTSARTTAYNSLIRIWRGMPTDVAGCIYAKDAAYCNTTKVLPYLRGSNGPLARADFLRLLQAKYDPTNPDQDAYIRGLTS